MTRQLVLIHGRSQEFRSAEAEKLEWLDALKAGLKEIDLELPIPECNVRLAYYGQLLYDMVKRDIPESEYAKVIVRGVDNDEAEQEFIGSMILEIQAAQGITDLQVQQESGTRIQEKGVLNWKWVLAVLRTLDTRVPYASGASVALATQDVYQYLRNAGTRDEIETGVLAAFTPNVETVVVAHSLGTVVGYNLLRREGTSQHWQVPLFVTLGSPLAVQVIKESLAPIKFPGCVKRWYNARDKRDVVPLYPLDAGHFPVNPAIENNSDVLNQSPNRHAIGGYLSDPTVARQIYDALTA